LVHFTKHLKQQQAKGTSQEQAEKISLTKTQVETPSPTVLQENVQKDFDPHFENEESPRPLQEVAYVSTWVRTKHAIMFQLNTRAVQVQFYDDTELFLSPSNHFLTYRTKEARQHSMLLEEAAKHSNVAKRLTYTNQVFHHLLCKWLPTPSLPSSQDPKERKEESENEEEEYDEGEQGDKEEEEGVEEEGKETVKLKINVTSKEKEKEKEKEEVVTTPTGDEENIPQRANINNNLNNLKPNHYVYGNKLNQKGLQIVPPSTHLVSSNLIETQQQTLSSKNNTLQSNRLNSRAV